MEAGPNTAPGAVDDAYSVDEDNVLSVVDSLLGVLGNDSDAEGDPLTAIAVSGPGNGGLALNGDGSFMYTPDANFNGVDSFSYKVNDGFVDGDTATVLVTVNSVNDVPVADAGPDQTVTDGDGDGGELVSLDGIGSSDIDGAIVSFDWSEGGGSIASGVSLSTMQQISR